MSLARSQLSVVAVVSAAVGFGLVPLLARSDFLHDRGLWIVLDLVIGAGFTGVGLFAWYRRPDNRVGALMVATAFAWYAVVAGNVEPPLLWTLGQLLGNLFVANAIHLLLAFPSGRLQTTVDRVLVGIAYVATTVLWLPFVLFTDPVDLGCGRVSREPAADRRQRGVRGGLAQRPERDRRDGRARRGRAAPSALA
jgi:hypothetical protein